MPERPLLEPNGEDSPARSESFERLLHYLRDSRGFDFTGYKRPSLTRRVEHRMREVGLSDFDEYCDRLQVDSAEFTALFNTILINVTGFFRDRDAWDNLRELLASEIDRESSTPLRVWSAGCASGQEAYTLAMILCEILGPSAYRSRVKVYATDVDEDALSAARSGSYSERELRGLPQEYRDKYFETSSGRGTVRPDLRRNVIFGRNDITQDAPISRVDVLSCRNTLMYLNAETQSHVLGKLSFALRPNGILFLGKAEMLINHSDAFKPIDLKRRFFRKTPPGLRARVDYPRFAYRLNALGQREEPEMTVSTAACAASPVAHLVVDAEGTVALINRRAATLFTLGERDVGRPFQDLDLSYQPVELRSHLSTVMETAQPVLLREMPYHRNQLETTFLDIQLVPLADERGTLVGVAISFSDVTRFRQLQSEVEATNRQLETAYEELQSTNEELETTNEELQSTVEELETTNEELQSSNEELETMNEELQSMNDELQTTNEELRDRTGEIDALNGFMESVLGGLNAAIIVVSPDLKVRFWNSQSQELWGLREDEAVGHPLFDLDSGIPEEALREPVRDALSQRQDRSQFTVQAVNRRGRTVQLLVTVAALTDERDGGGAMVLMEVEDGSSP